MSVSLPRLGPWRLVRTRQPRSCRRRQAQRASCGLSRAPGTLPIAGSPRAPPVDRFVENYWSVRWDRTGRPPYRQELIPHPCLNMSVESGWPGEVRHGFAMPAALLHGLVTRRFAIDLSGTGRVLGVRFRPGGFAALTGHSAGGLRDRVVPLAQVFGAPADALASEILAEED